MTSNKDFVSETIWEMRKRTFTQEQAEALVQAAEWSLNRYVPDDLQSPPVVRELKPTLDDRLAELIVKTVKKLEAAKLEENANSERRLSVY